MSCSVGFFDGSGQEWHIAAQHYHPTGWKFVGFCLPGGGLFAANDWEYCPES